MFRYFLLDNTTSKLKNEKMKKKLLFILCLLISISAYSQSNKHNIKGRVAEKESNIPIEGVLILDTKYVRLGLTDKNGEFNVQADAGRQLIKFAIIGYNTVVAEVDVRPITEFISVDLEQSILELNEITVTGVKTEPIGAKTFNPEMSSRFAGSLGDPARMVRSFAGVQSLDDSRNDIIIRGNSPTGLQWRVDGFEIPNPNHFGGHGLTGSPVTLLNTGLLTNSDFYLGGWDASYSNATSGIFDIKMRGQNDIKERKHWGQIGWNGLELGTEGNYDKNKKTTYLADYRYSFLGLMGEMGFNTGFTPEYQDFTFKTTAEIGDKHFISLLAIWGDSSLDNTGNNTAISTGTQTSLIGLYHQYKIKANQQINSRLSYIQTDVDTHIKNNNISNWKESSYEGKYSFSSDYSLRFETSKLLTTGMNIDVYDINYNELLLTNSIFRPITDEDGYMSLVRGFVQYQTNITNRIKTTVGVNASYLILNNTYSIEPRVSFKYHINNTKSLSFALGKYGQIQTRPLYFTKDENGIETNKDIGFTKNIQAILAYSWALNPAWHLKAEVYYQYLYNVPVVNNPNSTLTTLNFGAGYYIPRLENLVNKGKGYNYGIELTIEKYFQNNFYILVNGSLFSSKYSNGFNNNKYSTNFDSNFTLNLNGGYEWNISNRHTLLIDIKSTIAGGQHYTPLDKKASIEAGKAVYDYAKTNTEQLSNYFRTDLKITYRMNTPKFICDFAIDFQNITNHKNPYLIDYDFNGDDLEQITYYQQGFMPMFTFKIIF